MFNNPFLQELKNCELEMLLIQAKQDIANGNFKTGVKVHIDAMENILFKKYQVINYAKNIK